MRLTRWILVTLALLLTSAAPASAQKGKHASSSGTRSGHSKLAPATPRAPKLRVAPPQRAAPRIAKPRTPRTKATPAPGARDKRGRIVRSEAAVRDFEKSTGHTGGWKGHIVDHITPLACGGADAPSNMQWQTTAEAKAKDKVERKDCSRGR